MRILNKPISVVTNFLEDGTIQLVRFRLTDEDGEYKTILIDRVLKQDKEKIEGKKIIIYTCQVKLNEIQKICELRFDVVNMTWVLYKI